MTPHSAGLLLLLGLAAVGGEGGKSGVAQGVHCVLYPAGSSWESSAVVLYAKIASTEFENRDAFIEFAIRSMLQDDTQMQHREGIAGRTRDGYAFKVIEYFRPSYPLFERVVYVQFPRAIGYVVYSAKNWDLYLKTSPTLEKVIESIRYRPDFIGKKP